MSNNLSSDFWKNITERKEVFITVKDMQLEVYENSYICFHSGSRGTENDIFIKWKDVKKAEMEEEFIHLIETFQSIVQKGEVLFKKAVDKRKKDDD